VRDGIEMRYGELTAEVMVLVVVHALNSDDVGLNSGIERRYYVCVGLWLGTYCIG